MKVRDFSLELGKREGNSSKVRDLSLKVRKREGDFLKSEVFVTEIRTKRVKIKECESKI